MLTLAEVLALDDLPEPPTDAQLDELFGPRNSAPEIPHEDAHAQWRRLLGNVAPEWAVQAAVANGAELFEGEVGELLFAAVTRCIFEERGPTLHRLARHLLERGVDRFLVVTLLGAWAQVFCSPMPFEDEVRKIVLGAA